MKNIFYYTCIKYKLINIKKMHIIVLFYIYLYDTEQVYLVHLVKKKFVTLYSS